MEIKIEVKYTLGKPGYSVNYFEDGKFLSSLGTGKVASVLDEIEWITSRNEKIKGTLKKRSPKKEGESYVII